MFTVIFMTSISRLYSNYPPNNPCLCDSGKKAKKCCYKNKHWHKEPVTINPKQPITNYINHKCYASITCDCSEQISKEHYISQAILKQISAGSEYIKIEGTSWISKNDSKQISTKKLVARNLCKRHNEALSPIDAEAGRFFKILKKFNEDFKTEEPIEDLRIFCGEDIERWMLKTTIGMLQSGQLKNDDKPLRLDFDSRTIKVLYGQHVWPEGWGLYVSQETITYELAFGFTPIIDRTLDKFIGVKFRINNFVFNFGLKAHIDNEKVYGIFRPKTLIFQNGKIKKYLEFFWHNGGEKKVDFILNSKL